ncbi:MAG: beta-galactosidase [Planctomycetota bacterium]
MRFMTVIFAVFCLNTIVSAEDCSIKEYVIDAVRHVSLENKYVKVVIQPKKNGKIVSFKVKSTNVNYANEKNGISGDRYWQVKKSANPWNKPYEYEILKNNKEEVALKLTCQGQGQWNYKSLEKIISLKNDSSAVKLDYKYHVNENNMTAETLSPWVSNCLSPPAEQHKIFIPLSNGIDEIDYNPMARPIHQRFDYDVSRGWMAIAGQKKGNGLAFTFDSSRTMSTYLWFGNNINTMEWLYNSESVSHGKSLSSSHELIPFTGLKSVAGVGNGVVVQLDLADKPAAGTKQKVGVKLFSCNNAELTVNLKYEKLPGRLSDAVNTRKINVSANQVKALDFDWVPESEGTYAVHGEVFAESKKLCDFELPAIVGRSLETYVLKRLRKKLGDPNERYNALAKVSDADIPAPVFKNDIVTPHIKWGKPYYRGALRVFFLTDQTQARDIIELTQRFQIEPIVPLAITNKKQWFGDLWRNYTTDMALIDLKKRLEKRDFDVIVIGGGSLIWKKEHRKLIADLVKEGKGLVWISAPTPEELADILPLKSTQHVSDKQFWNKPENLLHPVTHTFPFSFLPETAVGKKSILIDNAELLVTAGKEKLIAVKEAGGAGRVVQMNYTSSWGGMGAHYSGLTPFDFAYAREPYPYWEYWYSLLGRAIIWSAKYEAPLKPQVTGLTYSENGKKSKDLNLSIELTGNTEKLPEIKVELVLRGTYAEELYRETKAWKGKPLVFNCGVNYNFGRNFADIRVLTQGKVLAWGTHGFVNNDGPVITQVDFNKSIDEDTFLDGEEIKAKVALKNTAPSQSVKIKLFDGKNRLLAESSAKAEAMQDMSVSVVNPLHPGGQFVVQITEGDRVLAEFRKYITLMPKKMIERKWDDFEGIAWGQMGAYQKLWIGRKKAEIMSDLGITVNNAVAKWSPFDMVWCLRNGLQPLSMNHFMISHDHKKDSEVRKKYQETGDKNVLVRTPSLSDPEFQEKAKKECLDLVDKTKKYYPLAYNFGDELSYSVPGMDYDFSKHAIKDFQKWLKNQYGSIKELNKEWQSNFKNFEEAIPFTSKEALESKQYARWADLRIFAGHSVAGIHDMLITHMKTSDKDAYYGISGTLFLLQ